MGEKEKLEYIGFSHNPSLDMQKKGKIIVVLLNRFQHRSIAP